MWLLRGAKLLPTVTGGCHNASLCTNAAKLCAIVQTVPASCDLCGCQRVQICMEAGSGHLSAGSADVGLAKE